MERLRSAVLTDAVSYGEGPRWHEGRLWFSDTLAGAVKTVDDDGHVEVAFETPMPSGLGWLPDGTLVLSTLGAALFQRVDDDGVHVVHDLGDRGWSLNDMVVGPEGNAYVDLYPERGGPPRGALLLITPSGDVRTVADGLATPNGLAITPDGGTLIVSETNGRRLLAFTITADGSLTERRVFAEVGEKTDGICLDEEGAVWVGCYRAGELRRVREGGEVTHVLETPGCWAVAPALGGDDRRTLYLMVAETSHDAFARGESTGRIERVRVDVPGAGWP